MTARGPRALANPAAAGCLQFRCARSLLLLEERLLMGNGGADADDHDVGDDEEDEDEDEGDGAIDKF